MVSSRTVVRSGSEVLIRVGGEEERWIVVAAHESDPLHRRVSETSPLGAALLGHEAGDVVVVHAPQPHQAVILTVG